MNIPRFTIIASILIGSSMLVACSVDTGDGDESTGSNEDALTNKAKTCTVDSPYTNWVNPPAKKTYKIGETFPSADGCNTCACTANGVVCTRLACVPSGPGGNTPSDGEKAPPIGK